MPHASASRFEYGMPRYRNISEHMTRESIVAMFYFTNFAAEKQRMKGVMSVRDMQLLIPLSVENNGERSRVRRIEQYEGMTVRYPKHEK